MQQPIPLHPVRLLPRKYRYLLGVPIGTIGLLLSLSLAAFACGPASLGWFLGAQAMILPAGISMTFYGLPLLAIVPAETFILQRREQMRPRQALGLVLWGNFFYIGASLFGMGIGFYFPVIGGFLSAVMLLRFYQPGGRFKRLPRWAFTLLVYLSLISLNLAHLWLIEQFRVSQSTPEMLYVVSGLIVIGTIFSFICKGFAIQMFRRKITPTFASTILSMQVISLVIVGIVGLVLAATGFSGSPFLPPLSFPTAL